ncbi:hypothetical protein [Roseateles sp.]|uniref:hypothetical protein n=1 Tax=Roseateles sp. TaxID=1971397 RepID=UPI00286A5A6A|nr:hypothetical protein [Roseateles sp.]
MNLLAHKVIHSKSGLLQVASSVKSNMKNDPAVRCKSAVLQPRSGAGSGHNRPHAGRLAPVRRGLCFFHIFLTGVAVVFDHSSRRLAYLALADLLGHRTRLDH